MGEYFGGNFSKQKFLFYILIYLNNSFYEENAVSNFKKEGLFQYDYTTLIQFKSGVSFFL